MRSFSILMPLEEEMPKRPPEDSFACVSVNSDSSKSEDASMTHSLPG